MRTHFAVGATLVSRALMAWPSTISAQGGVAAPGQSVKRPPAPTGPVPRLPDGSVDLSGMGVGGGTVGDIEREGGLKPGTRDRLTTPEAKKIYASRKEEDNLHHDQYGIAQASSRVTDYNANRGTDREVE